MRCVGQCPSRTYLSSFVLWGPSSFLLQCARGLAAAILFGLLLETFRGKGRVAILARGAVAPVTEKHLRPHPGRRRLRDIFSPLGSDEHRLETSGDTAPRTVLTVGGYHRFDCYYEKFVYKGQMR